MPKKSPMPCDDAMHELQMRLRSAIFGETGEALAEEILGDGMAPAARLRIYRHHAETALTRALQGTYPVVCRLVDERFFAFAAHEYRRARPPASRCLGGYGGDFPEFLAGFAPCAGLPYLVDVARLEWALHAAAAAPERPPLGNERLAAVPPVAAAHLAFRLQPSLSYLESDWPIDAIWQANQQDEPPPVDPASGGVRVEVRRVGDAGGWRRLDPGTFAFRAALAAGAPLATAVSVAMGRNPGFDAAMALRQVLAEKLVVGVAPPPEMPA